MTHFTRPFFLKRSDEEKVVGVDKNVVNGVLSAHSVFRQGDSFYDDFANEGLTWAFVLMTSFGVEDYSEIFHHMNLQLSRGGDHVRLLVLDFDDAQRIAADEQYPNAKKCVVFWNATIFVLFFLCSRM